MQPEEIIAYWCSPFFGLGASGVDEHQVFTDAQPIIFEGGRGTGKTMFLRYFSHEVQLAVFKSGDLRGTELLTAAINKGGLGLYIRMDGALIRDFDGKDVASETWDSVFCHYFELFVARKYLSLVSSWYSEKAITEDSVQTFLGGMSSLLAIDAADSTTIENVAAILDERIKEVRDFRARVSFETTPFKPTKPVAAGDLTFAVPEALAEAIPDLPDDFRFMLLIDEYENFSSSQQRTINTFLKFPRSCATFRVGMRLKGFHTTDTISVNEFLKKGRDYTAVTFEDILTKDPGYQAFLCDVARKRLEAQPYFAKRGWTDIQTFLGAKESLEDEARALLKNTSNKKRHFAAVTEGLSTSKKADLIEQLAAPENPLLEMLNVTWLIRNHTVKDTRKAMQDYLAKKKSELAKKYRLDYVDKYKLSLMFLLASHYKKDKQYYSFNTFCFLSSGIVGNFLELCRQAFQIAAFEEREALLDEGKIAPRLQSMAARDVGQSELDMIARIPEYGVKLSHFANSLGNCFRTYHSDRRLRYPETNQLCVDLNDTSELDRRAFDAALRWSVIQRKPLLQGPSPGKGKAELYTLNRILSPVFQISYRTRGGESETISGSKLPRFFESDRVPSRLQERDTKKQRPDPPEASLFPTNDEE